MVNGEAFSIGVGNDEKEAKQNAAKSALRSLNEKENPRRVVRFFFVKWCMFVRELQFKRP